MGTGGVVSITHVRVVAEPIVEPLFASTWNVCEPSLRPEYALGLEQVENDDPSSEHKNVTPD